MGDDDVQRRINRLASEVNQRNAEFEEAKVRCMQALQSMLRLLFKIRRSVSETHITGDPHVVEGTRQPYYGAGGAPSDDSYWHHISYSDDGPSPNPPHIYTEFRIPISYNPFSNTWSYRPLSGPPHQPYFATSSREQVLDMYKNDIAYWVVHLYPYERQRWDAEQERQRERQETAKRAAEDENISFVFKWAGAIGALLMLAYCAYQ